MRRIAWSLAALALAGCEAVPEFAPPPPSPAESPPQSPAQVAQGSTTKNPSGGHLDLNAPSAPGAAFRLSNLPAEWDGEETTGGLWVALPYLPAYERVLIRDPATGRAVVARLFWRDPGEGEAMLSSAAAQALGLSPGTAMLEAEVLE